MLTYPLFSIAVLHRLEKYTNDIIRNYQTGFIKGKSTTDHIFTIRQTLEKYYEFGKEIHICFVDFKQAYDSIIREELWKALEEFGVPAKLIQLVKECNSNSCCKVKFGKKISESFEVVTGLRQGDALSPTLFNVDLEKVMKSLPAYQGMELLGNKTILAYADDIMVIGCSREEIITKTADLIAAAKPIRLEISQDKTKYTVIGRNYGNAQDLIFSSYTFQAVTDFKYLRTNQYK
uniref:Retrovirus-related Pol polyprotein from type-2 retrotransposable element R2DM n=1 Tax=Schizaphis graminum TaxID=13262 RepID=A0A2S2NNU5_SCHGA